METMLKRIIITLFIAAIIITIADDGIALVITDSVGAGATKTEDVDPNGLVVDNFNDGGVTNLWGGSTGTFPGLGGTCAMANDSTSPYEGSYCLKLDYDVSGTTIGSYSGYFSLLQAKNLNAYSTISFWVKGASGGEFFKIELKNNLTDNDRNHAAVYITDYLDGGVTTSWQQVTIPFHNFANISNWNSMKEFVIVFESTQSYNNGSLRHGTIYIDKIQVDPPSSVNVVRIDHFGDKLNICALGGNMGDMSGDGGYTSHSFVSYTGSYVSYPYGVYSVYNVYSGWAGIWIVFGGGDNGVTPIPHDFHEYNYVSFYIRAAGSTVNPKVIKIELVDASATRSYILSGITTSWQYKKIPLSSFSGLNKYSIKQMNIVYEGWRIGDADGYKQGIIFIDKIQFEK